MISGFGAPYFADALLVDDLVVGEWDCFVLLSVIVSLWMRVSIVFGMDERADPGIDWRNQIEILGLQGRLLILDQINSNCRYVILNFPVTGFTDPRILVERTVSGTLELDSWGPWKA